MMKMKKRRNRNPNKKVKSLEKGGAAKRVPKKVKTDKKSSAAKHVPKKVVVIETVKPLEMVSVSKDDSSILFTGGKEFEVKKLESRAVPRLKSGRKVLVLSYIYTQRKLAKMLGVSDRHIRYVIKGDRKLSKKRLKKLNQLFELASKQYTTYLDVEFMTKSGNTYTARTEHKLLSYFDRLPIIVKEKINLLIDQYDDSYLKTTGVVYVFHKTLFDGNELTYIIKRKKGYIRRVKVYKR